MLGERLYEEALSVFMEGLDIAQKERLGERVLSTFHDHVAHTILQLRQQRACHQFLLVWQLLIYPLKHLSACKAPCVCDAHLFSAPSAAGSALCVLNLPGNQQCVTVAKPQNGMRLCMYALHL